MKKYEIVVPVTHVEGTQTYGCEAENAEEALAKFKAGGLPIIDEELDVTEQGENVEVYETDDISSRLPSDISWSIQSAFQEKIAELQAQLLLKSK